MVKKTYIIPEMLTVQLGTRANILQGSLPVDPTNPITDEGEILTKEQKGKNVWDEEW